MLISLNDDVDQDGGNSYVHGTPATWATRSWTGDPRSRSAPRTTSTALTSASATSGCHCSTSSASTSSSCGHEHHYERTLPIRGQQTNQTRTPIPRATASDVIDTEVGTVHMVIGGGGTSAPSNQLLFDPPQCRVIVSVGAPDPVTGKRPPVYVYEPDAPWSANRDLAQAYGFAAFAVDPGDTPGGLTSMAVTYYEIAGAYGELRPFETFTLQRHRRD